MQNVSIVIIEGMDRAEKLHSLWATKTTALKHLLSIFHEWLIKMCFKYSMVRDKNKKFVSKHK